MPTKQYIKKLNGYYVKDEEARAAAADNSTSIEGINVDRAIVDYIFPEEWSDGANASGDVCLIKGYGKTILIDAGTNSNEYKSKLYAFLSANGVEHIDYFVLSHYHSDHYGNLPNLINDGYIDSESVLYLPPYVEYMADIQGVKALYDQLQEIITMENLTAINPIENVAVEIASDLKLYFYNCDAAELNNSGYVDYNNYSMVCLVKHGAKKALFTGDCYRLPLERLVDEGFITDNIDLYKVEHHGIEFSDDHTPKRLLDVIKPRYAWCPANSILLLRNNISSSMTTSYLNKRGTSIFAEFNNTVQTVFRSTNKSFENLSGRPVRSISNARSNRTIYVNAASTATMPDGTSDKPFKDLAQAVGFCDGETEDITIQIAPGDYNFAHENADKNRPRFKALNITFIGDQSDNTAVKIHDGIVSSDSNIVIQDCTLIADTIDGISIKGSSLTAINCVFESTLETPTTSGINSSYSKINLAGCAFNNLNLGISTHYDELMVNGCQFDGMATGIYLRRTVLNIVNTTFANMSTARYNLDSNSVINAVKKKIYDGSAPLNGTIQLLDDITQYNKLYVESGNWQGGAHVTSIVLPYYSNGFAKGSSFGVNGPTGMSTITVDASDGTVLSVNSPTDNGIKRIYAERVNNG